MGVRTDAAADGPAALELLRARARAGTPYDAAIIDLHEPAAGGVQLMRAVRADSAIANTWLIAASAAAAEISKRAQHSTHADMWLARPIRPSQLLQSLNELLAHRSRDQVNNGGDGATVDGGPQARQRPEQNLRVLIVEDNAINQKLALNQLRKLGYAADAIDNGPGALELLARGSYQRC